MPKQLLIVTDDSGESLEILYARQRFLEAGWRPQIAATRRKRLHGVIHDFDPDWNTYVEKPGYRIPVDIPFHRARASAFDAVMCIGGRAPEFLRHEPAVIRLLQEFHRQDKWIFSICHGIQLLIAAGLVKGRTLTCYRNVRLELEQAGGRWRDEECVRDGRMITSQTWESHPDFYREIFRCLEAQPGLASPKGRGNGRLVARTELRA